MVVAVARRNVEQPGTCSGGEFFPDFLSCMNYRSPYFLKVSYSTVNGQRATVMWLAEG